MIPLLRGQRQAHRPSVGTAESQMPSPLSWGIGRAATLLKTLLQYYGMSLEALPGVAYPGFRDNRSTLNTKTGYLKKHAHTHVNGISTAWGNISTAFKIITAKNIISSCMIYTIPCHYNTVLWQNCLFRVKVRSTLHWNEAKNSDAFTTASVTLSLLYLNDTFILMLFWYLFYCM